MKKLSILASLAILSTSIMASLPVQAEFPDIDQATSETDAYEYFDAVRYVEEQGIVDGYPDGTYQPKNQINRAEFTKIIINTYFSPNEISSCQTSQLKFPDVPTDSWFAPYICVAYNNSIIQGYPDTTFQPGKKISFVEAAKIIAFTDQFIANNTIPTESDPWYKTPVEYLENFNAIPTDISEFSHQITRGEMAEIIYRVQKKNLTRSSNTYASINSQATQATAPLLEIGEWKGDFTLSSIETQPVVDNYNFDGEVTITGIIENHDNDNAYYSGTLCVHTISPDDHWKLPTLLNPDDPSFCFLTEENFPAEFSQPGSYGEATLTISGYQTHVIKGDTGGVVDGSSLKSIDKIYSRVTPLYQDDLEWNLFENFEENYSFKIPKTIYDTTSCSVAGTKDGQNYFYRSEGLIKFRAYSSMNSSKTFFAPSYYIESSDFREVPIEGEYLPFQCTNYSNSFDRLSKIDPINDPYSGPSWTVTSRDIKDEQNDLDALIKSTYGSGCGFEGLDPTSQSNTFDVLIDIPEDPIAGDCFVNYITYMKYNSELKKLVQWSIGQDFNFARPPQSESYPTDGYDIDMANSFKFID